MAKSSKPADVVVVDGTGEYQAPSEGTVEVALVIGDGQVGGAAYRWKGKDIRPDANRRIALTAHPPDRLRNTVLHANVSVQAVSPSRRTSVSFQFSGGSAARTISFDEIASQAQGLVEYDITFELT